MIWAGALVLGQILGFVRSYLEAQLEWRLLTAVRQRAHDHLQSLSLDFFTGERSGSLMQRVLMEASSIQRLITQCLIPPIVEIVVLVLALLYLLALSWQMTIVALVLSPLAILTFKYVGRRIQETTSRMVMNSRRLGGELEETISGIADVQIFNAQEQRSQRFYEASKEAAQNSAWMITWIHLTGNSAQVFIALSTALVLIVGITWGEALGLTFASIVVFVSFVPTMFAPAQRIIQAYTDYQSLVPSLVSTYDLLDTKPTVGERAGRRAPAGGPRQHRLRGRRVRVPGRPEDPGRPLVLDQGGRDDRAGRRRSAPASRRSSTCCSGSSIRRRAGSSWTAATSRR